MARDDSGSMQARIHRGAHEVGGSCIELEAAGRRLVLDLGRPISAGRDEIVPRPSISGLQHFDPSLVGVVITHPHLDHYGLSVGIHDSVPVFMGETAHRLLTEATFFTSAPVPPKPKGFLRHRETFVLGPFSITPFLNDHSAFDAYSLLVEADGRKVFYTGDIRGHGRKARMFEQLLAEPPPNVDVLLMEGTNIREGNDDNAYGPTERDVEVQLADLARSTPGMVLATFSPQNIDRLVTVFRAAKRSGRELVLDLYAATVAAATGLQTIPQASWDRVRVYVPQAQRRRVIADAAFERTDAVRHARIFPDEMRARSKELVVAFRGSMTGELERIGCLAGARAVWSMWPGYLKDESGQRLRTFLQRRNIQLSVLHSSGHAFVPDLQRLVAAINPDRLVPIHSFASGRFAELFPRVDRQKDGSLWAI